MIPFHIHTNHSLLQSTVRIDELIEKCRTQNIPALALTDTNSMAGLIQFVKKSNDEKIKPIPGSYINDPVKNDLYVLLLAKNNQGYSDLCKIITQRKLNDDFKLELILQKHLNNLIIITPSIELLKIADKKNQIYAEIIITKKSKKHSRELFTYATENKIPLVASNPVYFLNKEDYEIQKLVSSIRENKTFESITENDIADDEFYFKDVKEIQKAFQKIPEAVENTYKIASECNVDLSIGKYKFPVFTTDHKTDSVSLLKEIALDGFKKKYSLENSIAHKRLEYELGVIAELNFADYFLIVWDIVKEAKRRGMMLIGRGSAANSIVSYCLDFTQIDPVKYNLYFERFLNKARSNPPDIDLDFSWKERDEIIRYIFEKYGYDRVAMISTTVTFKARSAFRETAKAFGISEREISSYSKKIPWTSAANLDQISNKFPESKNLGFDKEPWKSIVRLASRLADFPRHLSIHPSGLVITPGKITEYCALEYVKNKGLGLIITQPDMYSIEDLGL
ncbi:MAG: PHP domain-containing protein, partial [Ignavibacteriaceae bacterium]|nr:PHP domain-containing protein [Ignavibacteriaceae bacterium]